MSSENTKKKGKKIEMGVKNFQVAKLLATATCSVNLCLEVVALPDIVLHHD